MKRILFLILFGFLLYCALCAMFEVAHTASEEGVKFQENRVNEVIE